MNRRNSSWNIPEKKERKKKKETKRENGPNEKLNKKYLLVLIIDQCSNQEF